MPRFNGRIISRTTSPRITSVCSLCLIISAPEPLLQTNRTPPPNRPSTDDIRTAKRTQCASRLLRSTRARRRGSFLLSALRCRQGVSRLGIEVTLPEERVGGNSLDAVSFELGIARLRITRCAHLGSFRAFARACACASMALARIPQLDCPCPTVRQVHLIR